MYTTKLRKVGGSVMFAIPKPLLASLGLSADRDVGLIVSKGRLIVDPRPAKRYSLEELIAQCDPQAPLSDEDRAWLDDAPRGREMI
jgi:antitoxin ChpS